MRVTAFLLAALALTAGDEPRFSKDGELQFPSEYREWVFLSSGLGMTYGQAAPRAGEDPRFDNVYVSPSAYRKFKQTGKWPEGSTFVLEIRSSTSEGSINKGGRFQGDVVAIEVEVKDTKRFPSGWAFFDFGGGRSPLKTTAASLGDKSRCHACHTPNGAVENTFVQFYPVALEIARRKGTLKPGF